MGRSWRANTTAWVAASLAFVQQPTDTPLGVAISPAVTVEVLDGDGNRITTGAHSTRKVTLALKVPGGATLAGTLTAAAVAGVATFSDLSVNVSGTYQLTATAVGGLSVDSDAFGAYQATVTHTDSAAGATSGSVFTFSGASIGAAAADRVVFVSCMWGSSEGDVTLSSVTIGGVPATIGANGGESGGNGYCYQCYLAVPAGTTADIVVTLSADVTAMEVSVEAVYGTDGSAPTMSADSNQQSNNINVTTVAGGAIVFSLVDNSSGAVTWTNADELYDGGSGFYGSTAKREDSTAQAVTVSHSKGQYGRLCAAIFSPDTQP